jgi:2'-5' RNA ligase
MIAKKYFMAIVIPEPVLSEIEGIKQELFKSHNLKGALRSPAHITLHRPFEWKEEKENILIEKLEEFKFETPFEIVLTDFAFFEPRVIYVDVLANMLLNDLHMHLTQFAKLKLKLFNESDDLRGFSPHITVAFRDLKKMQFYKLKELFQNKKFYHSFIYSGFSLLKLEKKWEEIFICKSKKE